MSTMSFSSGSSIQFAEDTVLIPKPRVTRTVTG